VPTDAPTAPPVDGTVAAAVGAAVHARRGGDPAAFEAALDNLVSIPRAELSAAIVDRAGTALARAWTRGWQPADIVRAVQRTDGTAAVRLVKELIVRQLSRYALSEVDESWTVQVKAFPAPVDDAGGYLVRFAGRAGLDPFLALRCAVEVLSTVDRLPALPELTPPPGGPTAGSRRGPVVRRGSARDPATRMLDRVRALLAKAESSDFASEADAFTAKAQELTARYSIDQAALTGPAGGPDQPAAVRIGVDHPYEDAKALLLQNVAEANLAQSVWSTELGFATVFGFPADLAAVELIYASLLVQGTAAMVRAGSGRRAREFRESFLYAYATRIGERLRTSAATAREDSDDLLPVLASREAAVREKVSEVFGRFTTRRTRIRDEHGWQSGTAAADLLPLNPTA
jgi:Protein of unknown function (DUF2786)